MLNSSDADSVLAALLKRRTEVEAWMEGPAKKATLTSIDRMMADLEDEAPSAASRAQAGAG